MNAILDPTSTFAHVFGGLESLKAYRDYWKARCPTHDDRSPSLSLQVRSSGGLPRLRLKCWAGCAEDSILDFLGLTWKDMYPPIEGQRRSTKMAKPTGTWDYLSADGTFSYQVRRFDHTNGNKSFGQYRRHPETREWVHGLNAGVYVPKAWGQERAWVRVKPEDPLAHGKEVWHLEDTPRLLYRLPELSKTDKGSWVIIPEGERKCHYLESLGFLATTSSGGAEAPWLPSFSQALKGLRVVILPDNDAVGRKHAEAILSGALLAGARGVVLCQLPNLGEHEDLLDWSRIFLEPLDFPERAAILWESIRANGSYFGPDLL